MFDVASRILVVDDMATVRKVIMKSFKELGFSNLSEAPDGKQAWDLLSQSSPPMDLIVSDWNMPNMTGIELLKSCRGDARYSKTPFLLVTAESEQANVVEAVMAGVTDYLIKPFTPDSLKQKLISAYQKAPK